MPKISKSCYTSKCYANYIKTSKQRILKTIMANFSHKEKTITSSQ